MVKTDDINTPEQHEPDDFSSPDEYIAGEHDVKPQGYSLQFDDDDRDSWNYDDEYRRKKDVEEEEEEDYLKDEDDMDIEDDDDEIFGEKPAWTITEEEEGDG